MEQLVCSLTELLSVEKLHPDQTFVESLLQVYQDKDNQPLLHVLCDLSKWDPQTDPLANFAVCYFSLPPKFKYFVKATKETFESHEKKHKKAYQDYLENKLQEFSKLL